jgi:hypothetical protein
MEVVEIETPGQPAENAIAEMSMLDAECGKLEMSSSLVHP